MYMEEFFIEFPEGDIQEISGRLRAGQLVDINGNPLALPLASERTIVFRVCRIRQRELRGSSETIHELELMSADELRAYVRP